MIARRLTVLAMLVAGTFLAPSASAVAAPAAPAAKPFTITATERSQGWESTLELTFDSGDPAEIRRALAAAGLDNAATAGRPALGPAGGDGSRWYEAACNAALGFADENGVFNYQHKCRSTTSAWAYQLLPNLRAIIVGNVSEAGIDWYTQVGKIHKGGPHPNVPKDYLFHGTFNPLRDGDHLLYEDHFYFAVKVNGVPGKGHVKMHGAIHQNG